VVYDLSLRNLIPKAGADAGNGQEVEMGANWIVNYDRRGSQYNQRRIY
jgi:hypothetical protein